VRDSQPKLGLPARRQDHFAADREAGDRVIAIRPQIRSDVRKTRAFLRRAVRYLAADAGIGQFLDIGTGPPSAGNTHEAAQAAAPGARVVKVDNDPLVLGAEAGIARSCRP
jgi:hypothetical protein